MDLEENTFSLPALIQRLQGMTSSLIQRKNIRLHLSLEDSLPVVCADEKKVQQVLLNLLSNAIKFTPHNGAITVGTSFYASLQDYKKLHPDFAEAFTSHLEQGSFFEVYISDSGIGIEKEKQETIFEAFHQVDSSMTRSYGGTGLGLALAKQFIELHHGIIWVESNLGSGARFSFLLPQQREKNAGAEAKA